MPHGLIAYSTYTPHHMLPRRRIAEALGTGGTPAGARSVAGYDEDAITMGVAAVRGLPSAHRDTDRLYLATATPPFQDKTNATVVSAASGRDDWLLALDLGGLRSGFAVLRTAADTGGTAVLADMRSGRPGSAEELEGGDGAAAFLFGDGDPVAEVLGTSSRSVELMDTWRVPGSEYPQVWEERFATHVYSAAVKEVASQVAKDTGCTDTPDHTLVASPNRRFAASTARSIGAVAASDVQDAHRDSIGYCGAAEVGMLLARTLDRARAGETIMLLSAVGGVDAMVLRVLRDGPGAIAHEEALAGRVELPYASYLIWRGFLEREPARRPERPSVAAPAEFRGQAWKFGLVGSRCRACGKVYLPPQRVCGSCGETDSGEPYPAADRPATVAAVSTDAVTDSPSPPAMAAMLDFDGGGRLTAELTDARPDDVHLGSRVEMTFRRTYAVRGTPNYFWKARPMRKAAR